MTNPSNTIGDAFQKLGRAISAEDAHEWGSTELKDVWAEVRKIDAEQRSRQSAQNMRRIEPFLKGIEKYSKVIEVLCNGTPYMPYVWAPVKLMLQLASQHRGIFEALLTAYSEIGAALPRFDRYEKVFKENLEFQNVLAAVYANILDFHQQAYKFFRRRAWHLIFLSLWKDFQSRFEGIIDSLKKQRDFVDTEALSIDILEARESRNRIQQDIIQRQKQTTYVLEQTERSVRNDQLRHSIEWLSVDDKTQGDNLARISHRRHDETCKWVMRDPKMIAWIRDDKEQPVLWLNGKPGAGKSVMCSFITQELSRTTDLDVCYYFCNSQEQGAVSTRILRNIALQLLRNHLDIASLISNEFVYRGVNCGLTQLKVLIPQILQIIPRTRILIDGVDECSMDTQKAVLRDLQALCLGGTIPCKILFSSRKEVHISDRLSGRQQISLDNRDEVDTDIRLYVKHKIRKIPTSDTDLLDKIESILVENSNGMFLWVRLVVEELRYCYSDADLESTATSLPKGLKEAYGRILDRILDDNNPSSKQVLAIRILEWMACSYRTLKTYEILDGIVFRPGCTTLNERTKMKAQVLDLCRPLIEDGLSNTLDFVHFSAKEYLLHEDHNGRPFISIETAQHNIAFSCVAYLNTSLSLLPEHSTDQQYAALVLQGLHGLQPYSNRFWMDHLLQHCAFQASQGQQVSGYLHSQLNLLLRFHKDLVDQRFLPESNDNSIEVEGIKALDQLPQVKALILSLIRFRTLMEDKYAFITPDKTPQNIYLDSCSIDPTLLSAVRYQYQLTLESLLSHQAPQFFPNIDLKRLKSFVDLYGASAFACHYTHCSRSTDGFSTARQRNSHEANHQRKFRCAYPSCANFASGFATRGAWNKHNDKYHKSVEEQLEQLSLSDHIRRDRLPKGVGKVESRFLPRTRAREMPPPITQRLPPPVDLEYGVSPFAIQPYRNNRPLPTYPYPSYNEVSKTHPKIDITIREGHEDKLNNPNFQFIKQQPRQHPISLNIWDNQDHASQMRRGSLSQEQQLELMQSLETEDFAEIDNPVKNSAEHDWKNLEIKHSKGGVTLNAKGRKKRKDYPSSWGCPSSQMKLKKRFLCVFDGPRRSWNDDMMLDTDYEVRMKPNDEKTYATDLDLQTMQRADAFHNSIEEERGPWIADHLSGLNGIDLEKLMEVKHPPSGTLGNTGNLEFPRAEVDELDHHASMPDSSLASSERGSPPVNNQPVVTPLERTKNPLKAASKSHIEGKEHKSTEAGQIGDLEHLLFGGPVEDSAQRASRNQRAMSVAEEILGPYVNEPTAKVLLQKASLMTSEDWLIVKNILEKYYLTKHKWDELHREVSRSRPHEPGGQINGIIAIMKLCDAEGKR